MSARIDANGDLLDLLFDAAGAIYAPGSVMRRLRKERAHSAASVTASAAGSSASWRRAGAGGVGGGEGGLQPVAEGHEGIDLRHDAVLFSEGWESDGNTVHLRLIHLRLHRASDEWLQVSRVDE